VGPEVKPHFVCVCVCVCTLMCMLKCVREGEEERDYNCAKSTGGQNL
jgi:hypothetical protein